MPIDDPLKACLRLLSPSFYFPASGDIGNFNYHPNTEWEAPAFYRGDPRIEQSVYREVASPGSQLGTLIDAVSELARAMEEQQPALANRESLVRLRELAGQVEATKEKAVEKSEERLRKSLDALAKTNKVALKRLLANYSDIQ